MRVQGDWSFDRSVRLPVADLQAAVNLDGPAGVGIVAGKREQSFALKGKRDELRVLTGSVANAAGEDRRVLRAYMDTVIVVLPEPLLLSVIVPPMPSRAPISMLFPFKSSSPPLTTRLGELTPNATALPSTIVPASSSVPPLNVLSVSGSPRVSVPLPVFTRRIEPASRFWLEYESLIEPVNVSSVELSMVRSVTPVVAPRVPELVSVIVPPWPGLPSFKELTVMEQPCKSSVASVPIVSGPVPSDALVSSVGSLCNCKVP